MNDNISPELQDIKNQRWIRQRQLDAEKFQPLLQKLIGERSMSEMARESNLNVSNISRLLSGLAKEPTLETLYALLDHAVPGAGVKPDVFLWAAGYRPVQTVEDYRSQREAYERQVMMIIVEWLFSKGHSVKPINYNNRGESQRAFTPDIVLETDAVDGLWEFEVHITRNDMDGTGDSAMRPMSMLMKQTFMPYLGSLYLGERMEYKKHTMVTTNKPFFQQLKRSYREAKVPDNLSIILIEIDIGPGFSPGLVVEEFVLQRRNAVAPGGGDTLDE